MNSTKPRIAVTLGDPTGIGPEIVVKALQTAARAERAVVIGDVRSLQETATRLGLPCPPHVEPVNLAGAPAFAPGSPSAISGESAFRAVVRATELLSAGQVAAIATAPLAKAQMQAAGHVYPGHTELLAHLAGDVPVRMMLASKRLRVVLVTIHMPLRSAIDALSREAILQTLRIAHEGLVQLGVPRPRFAVAGLNPHAGESGLFGREEIDIIAPAVADAAADGIHVEGPMPPDTVFMLAATEKRFDAVIALYHDQGLIPVKLDGLDQAVNITLGLPYLRTSPDHGTAFDIAGGDQADPRSMIAAIDMAIAAC